MMVENKLFIGGTGTGKINWLVLGKLFHESLAKNAK